MDDLRSTQSRQQAWNAGRIRIKVGEFRPQKLFFRANNRNINDGEQCCQQEHDHNALRCGSKTECNQHGADIQRIAGMRIRSGHRQLGVLLHVSGGISAQPEAGQHKKQAPRHGYECWTRQPEIHTGKDKAHGNANAPRDSAPVSGHLQRASFNNSSAALSTSSGEMVSNPASGSARRLWSRLLSGWRSTRKFPPNGPLRAGSVGPKIPTTGLPRADARCSGPVSPAMMSDARRVSAISSSSSGESSVPILPLALFTSFANVSSPGPALITTP